MPRQKLSEYRAKSIISQSLDLPYKGWSIDTSTSVSDQLRDINSDSGSFVVKVDEGVKGRFKKGLVILDVKVSDLETTITRLADMGYHSFIVEPEFDHDQSDERYISLVCDRTGTLLQYTSNGGVDVEQHADKIKKVPLNDTTDWSGISEETGISIARLQKLAATFAENYFVFLEINPYVVTGAEAHILDAAVEVDDAGEFFVDSWNQTDFRRHSDKLQTAQEATVQNINANSPASFSLSVLNPNGGIFLLLSGGGASVVVADEIYNRDLGEQLANYGEYSGNPNAEETYAYTKALLELLIASSSPKKVLFVGGAVANFTDIAKTFSGVIQAIDEVADKLKAQKVKVFVRRGGPNQEVGLAKIEAALAKHDLLGAVHDPGTPLTDAVGEALKEFL